MTSKKRYPSRYSPHKEVTPAQYIAELICEKRARFLDKELPLKFWELDEWKKFYKYQITLAYTLLQKYTDSIIVAALMDSRTYKTYSLRNPLVTTLCEEYQQKVKLVEPLADYDFVKKATFKSSNKTNSSSPLSKLKELE